MLADKQVVPNQTLILDSGNHWKNEFKNLPKYTDEGKEITYTIQEVKVENYSSLITGNMTSGFTVTNTNTEKVEIAVNKKWIGNPAGSVVIKLFAGDKQVGEDVTLNDGNKWLKVFTGLDK